MTEDQKLVEQLEAWGAELDADARAYDQAGPSVSIHADGIKKEAELLLAAADRIRALEGEREQIYEAAVETGRLEARIADAEREAALARAERLQAQVEELREGLKPFAKMHGLQFAPEITLFAHQWRDHFRRAHSLLSKQEKEG